jgi:sugar transferase (PEP-CTERM system associated)
MVKVFHVYYPFRTLALLGCEALVMCAAFLAALRLRMGPGSYAVLNYGEGWIKIIAATLLALLCSYYFDLYAPQRLTSPSEVYFRVLMALGLLSFLLVGVGYLFPSLLFTRDVFLVGLIILAGALLTWRRMFMWMTRQGFLCERVFVLGTGERATRVMHSIRSRPDLGMEVVGCDSTVGDWFCEPERLDHQRIPRRTTGIDRIIVALTDRRGAMPVRELLNARLNGISVEDAISLLEKVNGRIEVEDLYPSSLIFSEGFRISRPVLLARRTVSFAIAFLSLIICLPFIPIAAVLVKISSPGPILFRQERVGLNGRIFTLLKFRTMPPDAEARSGAVWADKDDPRVTGIARFLRKTRIDEIPQLWNVLQGEMSFVGPRPERPEFVQWLSGDLPYYKLRHVVRPGITGWAQVKYQYTCSLAESKQKLEYDLYYLKYRSIVLDLLIMFETIKTVVLRRGAQ